MKTQALNKAEPLVGRLRLVTGKEEYSDRKRRLKEVAQRHFPQIKVPLTNSDALLIMEFIGLKCQREPEWVLKRLPVSIVNTLNFQGDE